MTAPLQISLIGAGNVGLALGRAFIRQGHSVVFGLTDPGRRAQAVAELGPQARAESVAAAIAASEVVVLAVPQAAVAPIAQSVPDWQGKVLVDATNPLAPALAGLTLGTTTSGAEALAGLARGARVVKAFNTTGAENMADSRYPGGRLFMPVCSDDAAARELVMGLAESIGFEAVDAGPLQAARWLEPLAMVWIDLAFRRGLGRDFGFGLLRRG